jgi:hypothetical protein
MNCCRMLPIINNNILAITASKQQIVETSLRGLVSDYRKRDALKIRAWRCAGWGKIKRDASLDGASQIMLRSKTRIWVARLALVPTSETSPAWGK